MSEDATERFPPSFKPLLDALPPSEANCCIWLEDHWSSSDLDSIAVAIAKLGRDLQLSKQGLDKARQAQDLDAVRGGTARALLQILEALLPICGAGPLWPLSEAIDVFETAGRKKRHYLTALPNDEMHVRRDAPKRMIIRAWAAAMLQFFSNKLSPLPQEKIAEKIATAMGMGKFHVRSNRALRVPSASTVQQWRKQCLAAPRPGTSDAKEREMFNIFLQKIADDPHQLGMTELFDACLSDLTEHCKDQMEIQTAG